MSLVVASVSESTELFGWFDAQAASHVANTTRAIVFFKKISLVLEKKAKGMIGLRRADQPRRERITAAATHPKRMWPTSAIHVNSVKPKKAGNPATRYAIT